MGLVWRAEDTVRREWEWGGGEGKHRLSSAVQEREELAYFLWAPLLPKFHKDNVGSSNRDNIISWVA